MKISLGEFITGRGFLLLMMLITVLPFISIFTTALYPYGTVPDGSAHRIVDFGHGRFCDRSIENPRV